MALYNVGIVGCGFIGFKRANVLKSFGNSRLVMVSDIDPEKANELALENSCLFSDDWHDVTRNNAINLVIIATSHNHLAEIAIDAINHQKHVLIEKPAGRNPEEIKGIIEAYESQKHNEIKVMVGFNHRFHPSFEKAKEIMRDEDIGDIMFIRAFYGHGGRLGYDKEWRASKDISGGGELLDQGSHIIDLSRYFLGDLEVHSGLCKTFFWNMEVEDNCFGILKNGNGQAVQFHVSWTHWKNSFSFDIFCKTGQISINGLGKSYGKETLTFYKMKPEMGPPEKQVFEWPDEDLSWEKEYKSFIESIEQNKEPNGDIYDAYENMKIVYKIYGLQ